MPKAYQRCVKKVKAKGYGTSTAHAICTKVNAGNVKKYRRIKRKGT